MSVIRVITVASRKCVYACTLTRERVSAHNGRRSKFYPHLAIIQSCQFILLESRASVRLAPPSPLAPFLSSVDHSVSPSRVVAYTIVQRANIDKSVGAKTSEGLVPPGSTTLGCPSSCAHVSRASQRSRYTYAHKMFLRFLSNITSVSEEKKSIRSFIFTI